MTTYAYDDLGNLLSQVSPDTGTTTFAYDAAGNLATKTDAAGRLFRYHYDALNRLTVLDMPLIVYDITYTYDGCPGGVGRLCSVGNATAVAYAYDGFGQVTAHQGVAYGYDAAGRVQAMTYPSGAVLTYAYDAAGQLSRVQLTDNGVSQDLLNNLSYAPFGPVTTATFGNGLTLTQQYDAAYRLLDQTLPGVWTRAYTSAAQPNGYDANGNLLTRAQDGVAETFDYDALNRLTSATAPGTAQAYAFDANGNRRQHDSNGSRTTYAYEPVSNRLSQRDAAPLLTDANGNLTFTQPGNRSYAYTPHNRLREVRDNGLPVAGYRYNGLGQRYEKQTAATTTFTYGTDGQLLAETDNGGLSYREYFYANGQLLALRTETLSGPVTPLVTVTQHPALPGGTLSVDWSGIPTPTATDWIGLYVPGSPATDYLDWVYTDGSAQGTTTLTLNHPNLVPGQQYEVRLYANDGYTLLASGEPFTLSPSGPALAVLAAPAIHGDPLRVGWSGIATPTATDWIGLYVPGSPDLDYLDWVYTDGTNQGTATLTLNHPNLVPGQQYEIRLYANDGYTRLASAPSFVLADASSFQVSTTIHYVHNDHLGTPVALTDAAGAVAWRAVYDAFGTAAVNEDVDGDGSNVTLNVRLPGQYYDAETGLHYNWNRYYDPATGRYITSDLLGLLGGINTYAYAANNPLIYIDPEGESLGKIVRAIGLLIGIANQAGDLGKGVPPSSAPPGPTRQQSEQTEKTREQRKREQIGGSKGGGKGKDPRSVIFDLPLIRLCLEGLFDCQACKVLGIVERCPEDDLNC